MTTLSDRELDMLVAEKVMGWQRGRRFANGNGKWIFPEGTKPYFRDDWDGTPRYSTDIAAAWSLVEHTKLLDEHMLYRGYDNLWHVAERYDEYGDDKPFMVGSRDTIAVGSTAPEAICLAALKALE